MQDGINTMKKMIGIEEEKKEGGSKKRTGSKTTAAHKGWRHKRSALPSTK